MKGHQSLEEERNVPECKLVCQLNSSYFDYFQIFVFNRSFSSCLKPVFQSEAKCKAIDNWKWFFILIQINFIFTRKILNLVSFRKWEFLELGSGQLRFAVTERVERAVVLNKLDFKWRTGTENQKFTSQKQKKTRKRSRIVCHHLRKAGLPGLQGSRLALANSQNPSGFPKLPVKRNSSSKNWLVSISRVEIWERRWSLLKNLYHFLAKKRCIHWLIVREERVACQPLLICFIYNINNVHFSSAPWFILGSTRSVSRLFQLYPSRLSKKPYIFEMVLDLEDKQ